MSHWGPAAGPAYRSLLSDHSSQLQGMSESVSVLHLLELFILYGMETGDILITTHV